MKLGLFFEIPTADPTVEGAVKRRFEEALEQVELADELGFAHVWVVEHHFLPGYSHLSAPEVFLAAASQRTKNIRLGHAIVQLPFNINHPIRVAERIATLDILSNGRADFGGGRATSAEELLGFNVDPAQTRAQWEEALRMIPKMWTNETFSWESPQMTVPTRHITPKPVQKPHPPIWVACTQPATFPIAARLGVGVLGFGISDASGDEYLRLYREEIKKCTEPVGEFINNQFAILRIGLCSPTDEEALTIQGPNFRLFNDQVAALFAPWVEGPAPPTYDEFMKRWMRQREQSLKVTIEDIVAAGGAVIGSPETCLRTLSRFAEYGVDEVFLYMQCATTPHEKVKESIRLLAEHVMPKLE